MPILLMFHYFNLKQHYVWQSSLLNLLFLNFARWPQLLLKLLFLIKLKVPCKMFAQVDSYVFSFFHNIYSLPTYSKIKKFCYIVLVFEQKRKIYVLFKFSEILFALNCWIIWERSWLIYFLDWHQLGPVKSLLLVIIGWLVGWLVGNTVFSETTLRIFLIFCMKLGYYKGKKVSCIFEKILDLETFVKRPPN